MDAVQYLRCAAHIDRWPGDYRTHQLLAQNVAMQAADKVDPSDLTPWQRVDREEEQSPFDVFGE